MFNKEEYSQDKNQIIKQLIDEFNDFSSKEDSSIALFANAANHLKNFLQERANWVGFYLVNKEHNLELGPFNGLPAVTFIKNKEGVCGTCLDQEKTIEVKDICALKNHIVCDPSSRSEICIPVFVNNKMIALLDIDSPNLDEFSQHREILETYIKHLETYLS